MGYTSTNSSTKIAAQGIFMSAVCQLTVAHRGPTVNFGNYSSLLPKLLLIIVFLLVLFSAPRGFLWVLPFPLSSKTKI